jgi:hypothetical protein
MKPPGHRLICRLTILDTLIHYLGFINANLVIDIPQGIYYMLEADELKSADEMNVLIHETLLLKTARSTS